MNSESGIKTTFYSLFLCTLMLLVACGGEEESKDLLEALEVGRENVVFLQIISDQDKTLFESQENWQFSAIATRDDGTEFDVSEKVDWSVSDNAIASIDDTGDFQAAAVVGQPEVDVRGSWAHLTSYLAVTVSDAQLVAIDISAKDKPLDECLATDLLADGQYSDGTTRALTGLNWSVSDASVAKIDGDSLVSFISGNVDVMANSGNVQSEPLTIFISDTLDAINLNNGTVLNTSKGETVQLQAIGSYSSGQMDINPSTRWSSAIETVARVDDTGLLETLSTGATIITASCGGLEQKLSVLVVDVADIRIDDPDDDDMKAGESRQLELYKVFSDGSEGTEDIADDEDVFWGVETGSEIATISDDGEVTLSDDISNYEDSFIRIFAEFEEFEDTQTIRLDN